MSTKVSKNVVSPVALSSAKVVNVSDRSDSGFSAPTLPRAHHGRSVPYRKPFKSSRIILQYDDDEDESEDQMDEPDTE